MYAVITSIILPGNADVVLLGRAKGRGGYLSQATVSSIAWTLADATTGDVLTSGTFTVSAVIFDTLQTDSLWTKDAAGYNFRGVIPAASIPLANSGDRIQADVKFTLTTTGEVLRASFNWPTCKVYG